MITDPNCNAPLDFTMPGCTDTVVAQQFPYKTDADCGSYKKPSGEKYAHGNCWKSCENQTCGDASVSAVFQYKTNEDCPPGYQIDDSAKSRFPNGGDCYKACKPICSDEYTLTESDCLNSKGPGGVVSDGCNNGLLTKYKPEECTCADNYQYDSSNCNGDYVLHGPKCDGKFPSCQCKVLDVTSSCTNGCKIKGCNDTVCKECNEPAPVCPAGYPNSSAPSCADNQTYDTSGSCYSACRAKRCEEYLPYYKSTCDFPKEIGTLISGLPKGVICYDCHPNTCYDIVMYKNPMQKDTHQVYFPRPSGITWNTPGYAEYRWGGKCVTRYSSFPEGNSKDDCLCNCTFTGAGGVSFSYTNILPNPSQDMGTCEKNCEGTCKLIGINGHD